MSVVTRALNGLLDSKVIVITGAAGGIGAAAATYFAEQGAALVLTDLREGSVEEVAQRLTHQGFHVISVPADLRLERDVEQLFDTAAQHFGHLDGAFCNAGVGYRQDILETDAGAFDAVMSANTRSVFLCCKHSFRHMRKNRSGSLVLTSSRLAVAAYSNMVPYAASKGAILSMARALAVDFGTDGIRVNAVLPGVTETPMLMKEIETSPDPTQTRACFERQTLLGGIARPSDIAAAAAFLLSESARFITGTSLVVDGGCLARLFEGSGYDSRVK
jgi:NAD(P)-dependent dehydrogenase (short-subunit alcohol dehydrogenase family)